MPVRKFMPINSAAEILRLTLGLYDNTGWLINNVPNFAMMLYYLTIEFKQKERKF